MWVSDFVDDKLYAYRASDHGRDADKDFGTLAAEGNWALWSDGVTLWVADDISDSIFSYNLTVPGELDLGTLSFNGTAVSNVSADTLSYEVEHAVALTANYTIAATADHTGSTIGYSHADRDSGATGVQVGLCEGETVIDVIVEGAATYRTYELRVQGQDAPQGSSSRAYLKVDEDGEPAYQCRGSIRAVGENEPRDIDWVTVSLEADQLYAIVLKGRNFGNTDRTLGVPYLGGLLRMNVFQAGTTALGAPYFSDQDGRARAIFRPATSGDYQVVVAGLGEHHGTYDLRVRPHQDDHYPDGTGTESTIEPQGLSDEENFTYGESGRINYAFDSDWFRASDLVKGHTYVAEARPGTLERGHGTRYLLVDVYDENGKSVDFEQVDSSRTVFVPEASQDYYFRVYTTNRWTRSPYALYLHEPLELEGEDVLRVSPDGIFDPDGTVRAARRDSWHYRWSRIDEDGQEFPIGGATSASYVPVRDDVGRKVMARVCYLPDNSVRRTECRYSEPVPVHSAVKVLPYDTILDVGMGEAGSGFRSLFVSADKRDARSSDIEVYNRWVQGQMRTGWERFRELAGHFRALASTESVSALENTGARSRDGRPGVPVYWLGYVKVADDYGDLWDGSWDHWDLVVTSTGVLTRFGNTDYIWTGTYTDGEGALGEQLGTDTPAAARPGSGSGNDIYTSARAATQEHYLYGLSDVLHIQEPDVPYVPRTGGVAITSTPDSANTYRAGESIEFTLTFSESVNVHGDPEFRFGLARDSGFRTAGYTSGSGTTKLVFGYTVQAGDFSRDGLGWPAHTDANQPFLLDDDDRITDLSNTEDAVFYTIGTAGETSHRVDAGTMNQAGNQPATGAPVISGSPDVGSEVTADVTVVADPDGLEDVSWAYQWLSGGTEIEGATGSGYTLAESDFGQAVTVRVDFTDDAGNAESLTSAAVWPVMTLIVGQSRNTPATGQPAITGTAQVGEIITAGVTAIADEDGLDDATYAYQWLAGDSEIEGATTASYTLSAGEEGKTVRVRVSFTDDAGNEETLTSVATAAVKAANTPATGQPRITGTAVAGGSLGVDTTGIADEDGLERVSYAYQWLVVEDGGDREIPGATRSTHRLVAAEEGRPVRVRVGFTDDAGNAESLTSPPLVPPMPTGLTASVPASGRVVVLSWTAPDGFPYLFDYQILRQTPELGDTVVSIDTRSSATAYTDSDVEPGLLYRYRVRAANYWNQFTLRSEPAEIRTPQWTVVENAPATGQPSITGTAQVGETLTAGTSGVADEDGLENVSYAYRWLLGDAEIAGATGSSYDLTDSEEGKAVKVQVTFTDDAGNEETLTSDPTAAVKPANTPASGTPTISGTARVGETLTAGTSGVADEDGLENVSYAYEWLADGAEIQGATTASYTLTDSEEGKAVSVRVSFTDDADNQETLTSAATAAVAAAGPTEPPPAPTNLAFEINDDGHVVLSWDAPQDDHVTGYRILRRRPRQGENTLLTYVENTGGVETTYTDQNVVAGELYVYRVQAINDAGVGERSRYVNVEP